MSGVTPVPGVPYDEGRGFSFSDEIPKLRETQKFVDEIASSMRKQKQMAFVANVRVNRESYGTLFAIESKDKGKKA